MFTSSAAAALLGLAGSAVAQGLTTTPYSDPNTGIDFQSYQSTGYSFGIALPETVESDFIGQLVVPLTSTGEWGGVSLKGGMLNSLLFVAWASGDDIVSSFRITGSYANPDVYTDTEVNTYPIANGTFVNSTHLSYTFLCKGCIVDDVTSLKSASPTLGWAISSRAPATVTDPASALNFHSAGFGEFGVDVAGAKSASYAQWASWASTTPGGSPGGGGGGGGNGTLPAPTVSDKTYDVIVVGGGAAGIIVAERLAEKGVSVLLLERGPANTVALGSKQALPWNETLTPYDIPALGSSMTSLAGIELCSDTASTAGCLLGGSSSINGENFIHPPEHDWERWPAGWSSADIAAAEQRLYERNPGTTLPSADGKYYNAHAFDVVSSYLDTEGWTHVDSIKSPNEKHNVYSRPSWSIQNHLRAGPARTYTPFAQKLPNFTLQLNTKVVQALRKGSSVTGILTLASDGKREIINVNKGGKVVLAGGALSTPRLLWHSGIGRSDALEIVKQEPAQNGVILPEEADWIGLPVGHGLQDHAQVTLQFNDEANVPAYDFNSIATNPNETDLALYYQGSGVITQAAQRMHLWTSAENADGRTRYFQGTVSAMQSGVVTVRAFLTHGTSTHGELGISTSGNTVLNTKPWLIDEQDHSAMAGFVQWWLDITSGSNSTLSYVKPGAKPDDIITDNLISGDHWVGSAKMGTDDGRQKDGTSVVDLDTKVYGTDNLFVVDASIHPDLPTGNTQAIIMIVAEHAAEKIAAVKVA